MARTVNLEQHEARRVHIIDAALTCFASQGYNGATIAAICHTAGIGSGTLFHYFPTKAAVLVAILEHGTRETQEWFAAQDDRTDARQVVLDWVRRTAEEASDPRVPGFVRAVGAAITEPAIAAALQADEDAQRDGLRRWMLRARHARTIRTDLSAVSLTSWVMLLLDGFLGRLAADKSFTARGQRRTLVETVDKLLG